MERGMLGYSKEIAIRAYVEIEQARYGRGKGG
jgi:hypothetical protein